MNDLLKKLSYFEDKADFLKKTALINTDSREIKPGEIFLALRGANFDGHEHIHSALEKGAAFAIAERVTEGLPAERVCLVPNTLAALQELASLRRQVLNPLVIGVTGSSGKTTTKDLLRLVLSKKFKVHATEKNFNNEIGLPKTILAAPSDTQIMILEMGMRGLGEISLLSKIAQPNIALITNIGTAHIERLGSVENIRRAKFEICAGLCAYDGWDKFASKLVVDSDNHFRLTSSGFTLPVSVSTFDSEKKYQVGCLSSPGLNADINAVALVANSLGMSEAEIQKALLEYQPGKGRGEILKDSAGNIFIDDSYNANPESVRNSVEALIENFPDRKKIAVIGDIAESSPELVEKLFTELGSQNKFTLLDARSKQPEKIAQDLDSLIDGNSAVLIKASRSAGLEGVLNLL